MRCFDEHLSVFHNLFKRFKKGVIGRKREDDVDTAVTFVNRGLYVSTHVLLN